MTLKIINSVWCCATVRTILIVSVFAIVSCGNSSETKDDSDVSESSFSLLTQGLEISSDSLVVLESAMLSDQEMQTYYVDGVWRQRFLGETKFRPIEEYDYDILRDFPRDTEFDVVLDLRDSSQFALASTIADSLEPSEKEGFHRCRLNSQKLRMLIINGVNSYAAVAFRDKQD